MAVGSPGHNCPAMAATHLRERALASCPSWCSHSTCGPTRDEICCVVAISSCNECDFCNGGTRFAFDARVDVVSLHYDCSADPDDFVSSAADRAMLEATYGTAWLRVHVLPVIGTFGLNMAYQRRACERVASAVWGDSGAELLAASFYAKSDDFNSSAYNTASADEVVRDNEPWRISAARRVSARWQEALQSGGQIYVKEGGQSDFTRLAVELLVERIGDARVSKCVHVVQHSKWNENMNSPGVTAWLLEHVDYVGSVDNQHGPMTDGNVPMKLWAGCKTPP